ncbi:MAG: 4Fe-4S dicluster domain-containing protein [Bryobacteraceae bacterium]|nr:4Fe-4S dicluster domain-containing protein [Bryobacteraceae bacterium]
MENYGWLLDPKRCIECRACESACKQWNQVEIGVGVRYRQVRVRESGVFPAVRMQALSGACNHCDDPYCMKVCPGKAIYRRAQDGLVQIDQSKCLSCQQCAKLCAHQAPQFNTRTKKMEKCTGCFDRIEVGLQPACAEVCPTAALRWGKWSDIANAGSESWEGYVGAYTKPHLRFVTDPYPMKGNQER